MYQRRSNLQNLMILLLDCLTIFETVGCLKAMMPGWISAFCSEQCLSFFWR